MIVLFASVMTSQPSAATLPEDCKEVLAPVFETAKRGQPASHVLHLHVGWTLLKRYGYPSAFPIAEEFYRVNQRPDALIGYHSTITLGYMRLLYDAMKRTPGLDFEQFQAANSNIFANGLGILREYYSDKLLFSPEARAGFVDGDLKPLPDPEK